VTLADAAARLNAAFRRDLPGPAAQARMAPMPRRRWPRDFKGARIRNAAGLLLVFPGLPPSAGAQLVLTVRADTLRRHRGQVSLPGGVLEPGETFEQAALREAHEEIGLPLNTVGVLGALTPLDIPVSGFRLHPVVALSETRPVFAPVDAEVAHILEVAVDDLLDPRARINTTREREGLAIDVPAYRVANHEIWGATAMVLAEFLALLG
jgi:8-oxo-dGTP pyrophosphatase MutT (NUDIX family)